jgi:succinate-acetate transporter protein
MEVMMSSRKPTHHFGLAVIMALFAFFPFRLNSDSMTSIDVAAVIVFGLLAVIFVVIGVLAMRRKGPK